MSLGLITLTYGLFIAFDCRLTLIDNYKFGILIPIICTVLYVFVLAMLFRTSFSDPGVVPRKLDDFIHWLIIVPCAQLCTLQLEIIDRILGTEGLEKTRCPLYQYFIIQSKKEPHNTKQKRLRDKRWMKKELKQATRGTVRLLESVKSKYPEWQSNSNIATLVRFIDHREHHTVQYVIIVSNGSIIIARGWGIALENEIIDIFIYSSFHFQYWTSTYLCFLSSTWSTCISVISAISSKPSQTHGRQH